MQGQGSKTKVHDDGCPHQGRTSKNAPTCNCPRRLAFKTVDSYIGQLRPILRDHLEASGTTLSDTLTPNPTAHASVKRYLKAVTEEQLKAWANPKQAEPLFIGELVALCQVITDKLHSPGTDPVHLYIHARDLACFKLHFLSGDWLSDLSHIKAAEILRFPNDKGILFNHVFGKTLWSGDSRVFAVGRHPNTAICPVKALDDYISICTGLKISVHSGPLFRTAQGNIVLPEPFSTDATEAHLKSYLEAAGISHKTLYSFRCGGTITMALTGSALDDIIEHVGWKSHRMARHYLQLHKSLQPDSVVARISQATPETSSHYSELNQLQGFEPAFPAPFASAVPLQQRQSPRK